MPEDTKSGARFERVVIDGQRYVLKYQDPRDDWLLRASGDPGERYVRLWEEGLLGRMPDVIDPAVVAGSFARGVGMVLLRDVTAQLLPPGRPFSTEQHLRFVDHMAALHAAFWGWRDEVGLTPLAIRYLMFSPTVAKAEAARGSAAVVP
ncbi:MAG: aminoglycoside phosphotransferase, partial [Actinomycetes bacterium]